jgi:hypothetical protein
MVSDVSLDHTNLGVQISLSIMHGSTMAQIDSNNVAIVQCRYVQYAEKLIGALSGE